MRREIGFSLVEIVLALGIISVGCVAIFGLLGATASGRRLASEETAIAMMSRHVISSLRRENFDDLSATLAAGPRSLYFDGQGNPLTNEAGSHFQCVVDGTADPSTISAFSGGGTRTNLMMVRLRFTWPTSSSTPNERTIFTGAAR